MFIRILTVLLMLYRVRGAILIGIFLVSVISWPRPTSVTLFPYTEAGDALFDYFKQVVTFHPLTKVGNVIDVSKFSFLLEYSWLNENWCYSTTTVTLKCGMLLSQSYTSIFWVRPSVSFLSCILLTLAIQTPLGKTHSTAFSTFPLAHSLHTVLCTPWPNLLDCAIRLLSTLRGLLLHIASMHSVLAWELL